MVLSGNLCPPFAEQTQQFPFRPIFNFHLKANYLTHGSGLHSRQMPVWTQSIVNFPLSGLIQRLITFERPCG